MKTIVKIIIAVVALLVIHSYIAPLLLGVLAPFGLILTILLYVAVVAWLLGWSPVL